MRNQEQKGEIIIYKSPKGPDIQVKLEKDTVWLGAHLIARLFGVNRPAVVKHINNIYKVEELDKKTTCSILEQVAADGKVRKMNLYNLDMIISIGYRVNSKRATQFRIWATKTLKDYLVKGYIINEKRLLQAQEKFGQLQKAVAFLQAKSRHELLEGQSQEILDLLSSYSKSLSVLEQYDTGRLETIKEGRPKFTLEIENCREIIKKVKRELAVKSEASGFFGQESPGKFEGIIKGLYQTFDGKELYKSTEEKASHLLYLVIKDHPFVDGNKRIASFLFIYFLDRNDYLYKENGEQKINDNALTALALLIAVSDPKEKEIMIKIITNLLK